MNKVDLKDDSEVAISPWRKGQPRKPIDQYDQSPKSPAGAGAKSPNASNTENMSPPNTDHKESTKIESSINQVNVSGMDLSGASPALFRSEETRRTRGSSFTKVKSNTSSSRNSSLSKSRNTSKLMQSKTSELFSDDEPTQPSGSSRFVGTSHSNTTINNMSTNSTNTSVRRRVASGNKNVNISTNVSLVQTNNIVNVTPPPANKSQICYYVSFLFVACIAILGCAYVQEAGLPDLLMYSNSHTSSGEHWQYVRQQFTADLSKIKTKFRNQTSATWRMIGATLKSPLQTHPDYPGVLLLLASPGAAPAARCLSWQLLQASSSALSAPGLIPPPLSEHIIKAEDLQHMNPDEAKERLTSLLHSSLQNWGTVGIDNLKLIHPTAALTLHAFADNSNAPFKQAVMILNLESPVLENEDCKLESEAEKVLSSVWKSELGTDKLSALLSRIVVSVAHVREESSVTDVC